MKKLSLIALSTFALALQAEKVSDLSGLRIGYLDSVEVMRTSKDGIDASRDLEAKRNKLSSGLQEDEKKLTARMNSYKEKASSLTDAARSKEEKELQRMQRELQERVQECEQELQAAMQERTGALSKEVESAALRVMDDEKLDAVVDKASGRVLCTSAKVDYTKRAVAHMDKSHEVRMASAKKAPEAKKAA